MPDRPVGAASGNGSGCASCWRGTLVQQVEAALPAGEIDRMAERVAKRELDPYSAVSELIATATVGRVPPRDGSTAADPATPQ